MPANESIDGPGQLDALALDLRQLRAEAGLPSYGEVASLVARLRRSRGLSEAEARVGRTTVYDVFRTGRRRVDVKLVTDIVRVLGGDEADADRWSERCRVALAGAPGGEAEPVGQDVPHLPGVGIIAGVIVGGVLVNLLGRGLVDLLHLPVYLDMIGTALSAVVLGPWWGALVGVLTNLLGTASSGPDSLPFGLVNLAGALVWGYGVRRFGMGRTIPRFFVLSIVAAVVCTFVAVPIIVWVFGGLTGHGSDDVTAAMLAISHGLVVSLTSSNLLTSVSDKLIAGFVALAAIEALPRSVTTGLPSSWMNGSPDPARS